MIHNASDVQNDENRRGRVNKRYRVVRTKNVYENRLFFSDSSKYYYICTFVLWSSKWKKSVVHAFVIDGCLYSFIRVTRPH